MGRIREARLHPDFAHLYPPIPPDEWLPAAEAGARMVFWLWSQHERLELPGRVLDSRHFEFREGWARGDGTVLRTRAGDVPSATAEASSIRDG